MNDEKVLRDVGIALQTMSTDCRIFEQHPQVTEKAAYLASRQAIGDTRTPEQKYNHSVKGLAVQYAVADHLQKCGINAQIEQDHWEWDINVGDPINPVRIDTKAIFSGPGKYVNRTKNEQWAVPKLPFEVYYVALDCRQSYTKDGKAQYIGWAPGRSFMSSLYNPGGYVYRSDLNYP